MSDKTFKQQVEEIVSNCPPEEIPMPCDKDNQYDCMKCRTERILSAHNAELDRIAEGMPPVFAEHDTTEFDAGYYEGLKKKLAECQAYIQAQKGS